MSHYRRPARRPVGTPNRWPVWGANYGPGGHRVTTPQFLDRSPGRFVISDFGPAGGSAHSVRSNTSRLVAKRLVTALPESRLTENAQC
jgi:hypothetical protein